MINKPGTAVLATVIIAVVVIATYAYVLHPTSEDGDDIGGGLDLGLDRGLVVDGAVVIAESNDMVHLRCYNPDVEVELGNFGGELVVDNCFPDAVVEGFENQVDRDGTTFRLELDMGDHRIRLKPPADDDLSFAVFGDNQGCNLLMASALENLTGCDFAIHCGDLTPSGRYSEFEPALEALNRSTVPVYITLGNHDVKYDGKKLWTALLSPTRNSFEYVGTTFCLVDSSDLSLSEDELEWAAGEFDRYAGSNRRVMVTHVPFLDPFGFSHTLNNDSCTRTREFVQDHGIDLVLNGHIHAFYHEMVDNTDVVISGGAGAVLVNGTHHYTTVSVENGEFEVEEVELDYPSYYHEGSTIVQLVSGSTVRNLTLDDLMTLETVEMCAEYQNQLGNYAGGGNYTGVAISSMLWYVGGMDPDDSLKVVASDGYAQDFGYRNVYPNATFSRLQGQMILALSHNGEWVPTWEDGPRIAFLPEDGVYDNSDCELTSYPGQGYHLYPSAGGRWVKFVHRIEVTG